ncbi:hypothetical protein DDZ18_10070 [Marinicauda salina]|uniref:Uncharacterized protein n=1 Tax=Marinicauda salina TaxID=2135793 RepID=A0A2U2BSS2_9PROT|nr:hypothetical protein [Marinicauda salina]PWE17040.1 hypothetical protein DDZ18_10070 [Marinicauda salina]
MGATQGLAFVLLRTTALFFGIGWLAMAIERVLGLLLRGEASPFFLSLLVQGLLMISVCAIFWVLAGPISARVSAPAKAADAKISVSGDDLFRVGVALLGIYFISQGLAGSIHILAGAWIIHSRESHITSISYDYRTTEAVVRLVFGIALLFALTRIDRLMKSLRRYGLSKLDEPSDSDRTA